MRRRIITAHGRGIEVVESHGEGESHGGIQGRHVGNVEDGEEMMGCTGQTLGVEGHDAIEGNEGSRQEPPRVIGR